MERSMLEEGNRPKEALTSSEQELRLLVETIPTLVWRAAPEGNIVYVNKRVLEYLGAPLGEVIGWGWMDKVHPGVLTMQPAEFEERTVDIDGSRSAENHCEPTTRC